MKPTAPLAVGDHSPLDHGTASRRTLLRGLAAAAVLVPAGATLAACGDAKPSSDANAPVELSIFWWGAQPRADATDKVLALYTQKHPNVTFKKTWQANAGYYDKLATLTAGGNAPDIFQIDDGALSEYGERNQTLDLNSYKGGKLNVDKISPALLASAVVGGKLDGVPMGENTPGMIYNKTLLKSLGMAEPTTGMSWADLITWAGQVTTKSGGKVYGTMDPSADYKALWVWLRQQGKELYGDKSVAASVDDVTKWFEFWKGARDSKAAPPADIIHVANTGDATKQLVVSGKAATSFLWANQITDLSKATKDELGVVAYPGDPKGQWARAAMYFAGYKGTKHADIVVDVLNFLVNDVEAGKIIGTDRGLNANSDVRTAVTSSLTDNTMKTAAAFETDLAAKFGTAPPVPPKGHVKVRALLITYAENVQYGKATPAAAADAFLKEANAAVAG
jgi:multiple sugar transport system substrate-binding protein